MNLKQKWDESQSLIRELLGIHSYAIWVQQMTPIAFGNERICFRVPNQHFAEFIEKNIEPQILELFAARYNLSIFLDFTIDGEHIIGAKNPRIIDNYQINTDHLNAQHSALNPPKKTTNDFTAERSDFPPSAITNPTLNSSAEPRWTRPLTAETVNSSDFIAERRVISGIPENKTFDNFVVGSSNQFAHAAAQAVADKLGDSQYNPLFIYGSTGLGKTHLLHAIANSVLMRNPETTPIYVTAEIFTNELIEHIRTRRMNAFRQKFRDSCQLLLIDDIQFLSNKDRTQEELFHTFEYLKERGFQIVFTADVLPRDIAKLEPRLRTRFESGMLADMHPPDLETMIAITQQKAAELHFPVAREVAEYIANGVRGNVREVEGILNRLQAYCSFTSAEPTLAVAIKQLSRFLQEEQKATDIGQIIQTVSTAMGVPVSDIKGKKRSRSVVRPRHIAMYLARQHTQLSLPEIGKAFSGRDHSAVLYAVNRITNLLSSDPSLRETINLIRRELGL